MSDSSTESATYSFGESARPGVLLGFPPRQVLPVGVGVLVAAFGLMAGLYPLAIIGPLAGLVIAFARWRGAPLYEIAVPSIALLRAGGRKTWTAESLVADDPESAGDLPAELRGLELVSTSWEWATTPVGAIRDRVFSTVSATIGAAATGFPMKSLGEQDGMLGAWGSALAPFARPRSPVCRITWQEWSHPKGVDDHRTLLGCAHAGRRAPHPDPDALADYELLLGLQAPVTVAHDVTITLTVELRRVSRRGHASQVDAGLAALGQELELFVQRLESVGITPSPPLSANELSCLVRMRSDPSRANPRRLVALRQSLATATGRTAMQWGPMAAESAWSSCRVDESVHRTYRMVSLPLLPVPANWLDHLLTDTATTRTVTVVYEPIPFNKAAAQANRELTSLESSNEEKARRGFRVTARERRRLADVEGRERELAQGPSGVPTRRTSSRSRLPRPRSWRRRARGSRTLPVSR